MADHATREQRQALEGWGYARHSEAICETYTHPRGPGIAYNAATGRWYGWRDYTDLAEEPTVSLDPVNLAKSLMETGDE
jgi:hypothetical protein